MNGKHPGGRPPMYSKKEEIEYKIEDYFKKCEGEMAKDADGNPLLDKWGNIIYIGKKPPTVTGLALALGFNTRLALLNYQGKPEFENTITRAKAVIEQYAEERLFDRDGVNGAKFSLANNFKNWTEKQQIESTNLNVNREMTEEEAEKILKEKGIDI